MNSYLCLQYQKLHPVRLSPGLWTAATALKCPRIKAHCPEGCYRIQARHRRSKQNNFSRIHQKIQYLNISCHFSNDQFTNAYTGVFDAYRISCTLSRCNRRMETFSFAVADVIIIALERKKGSGRCPVVGGRVSAIGACLDGSANIVFL